MLTKIKLKMNIIINVLPEFMALRWSHLNLIAIILIVITSHLFVTVTGQKSIVDHRNRRDSNSVYSNGNSWIQTRDNRRPYFLECKEYAPSVREEQPPNTFVIRVQAEDPDESQTINYSFVQAPAERPKFRIDPKTGVITTAHTFDRDEPIYEKEIYVTVRATDNGRPALDDVCTFKVIIEDINDNPPVFNKAKYDESMSEDLTLNTFVMRISATDLDNGDNSIIEYEILPERDYQYFRIDKSHGIIYLNRPIDKRPGQYYTINVRAYNVVPEGQQDARIEVKIRVIESNKRPPAFIRVTDDVITLPEDFMEYGQALSTLHVVSNVPDKPEVVFELVTGRTEQTNSKKTFILNQQGSDSAKIYLGKSLDYEAITDYTLTVSIRNTWELVSETIIKVKVKDVNDNIPYFTEVKKGTILENEPRDTPVMQVRAFDMDGTSENNIVSFELDNNKEYFEIDSVTGNITSKTTFDREEKEFYSVKVIASDNSPSALLNNGQHNKGIQVFIIQIADKNDHPPHFQRDEYIAEKLPENANINHLVIEVTAIDEDNAAQIIYTIESGNIDDAFKIEELTGKISVNHQLDYEKITEYTLRIKAFDGTYDDHATVTIKIEDVNDNVPLFVQENYNNTIQEEKIIDDCIINIEAYDPDIKDRFANQYMKYTVVRPEQQKYMTIDDNGCLRLIRPLDRDQPNGYKNWQVTIKATDENGNGLSNTTIVTITLIDINDNAPFITNKMPVIWQENRNPGQIVQLEAKDYDEQQNGPPFMYGIDAMASHDIKSKFSIDSSYLYANVQFDREDQKEYFIPITVSDSGVPKLSQISWLHLIIGDVNDNAMESGKSKIFVYNYKGEAPDTEIGRIYVNDPDDWDLDDKTFMWKDGFPHDRFRVNEDTGMITMKEGTAQGDYFLTFVVTEESPMIPHHQVDAEVMVKVKEIPEEAVDKSGSVRLYNISAEEFVRVEKGENLSLKDKFQRSLAHLFNTSVENVDVFTVLNYNLSTLDVRFSAHGSPYYAPEKLNGIVAQNREELESILDLQILMVNIDECLIERNKCESSCTNVLHKSNVPLLVYSNTTSFVGVNAFVQAECICEAKYFYYCLNGGTLYEDKCDCPDGYNGVHCEITAIGFWGQGYAMYPPISPCDNTKISLQLAPQTDSGLVMYIGPMTFNPLLPVSDYLALELVGGFPVLTVDYGTGGVTIEHKHIQLQMGELYTIDIVLQKASIEMTVNNCKLSTCMSLGAPQGPNEFLNVNSPLQLGGTPVDLEYLGLRLNWTHIPSRLGYHGCIRNLTIDGFTYNLGEPAIEKNSDPGCQNAVAVAVSFGIDRNFLIAILVCVAILLILLLAVVVQKKQQAGWHEKDIDDIRETIINYEDEGGGERDTDYDLNVLRSPPFYDEKPYKDNMLMKDPNDVPDIGGFLGDKKDTCDRDSGAYPTDDVRHYAYEGDGNSDGSLSSLASCTDDGDLNFDYLSNFGPRFRKLADMYGEEPSDDDSNVDDDPGWRI